MGEHASSPKPAPSPASAAEGQARPKVMRRPAALAAPTPTHSAQIIAADFPSLTHESTASRHAPLPVTARAWQDDGRFAMLLLALVVLLNLAIIGWLGLITPKAVPHAPLVQMQPSTTPEDAATHDRSAISVFTAPAPAEEDSPADPGSAPAVHTLDDKAIP